MKECQVFVGQIVLAAGVFLPYGHHEYLQTEVKRFFGDSGTKTFSGVVIHSVI